MKNNIKKFFLYFYFKTARRKLITEYFLRVAQQKRELIRWNI